MKRPFFPSEIWGKKALVKSSFGQKKVVAETVYIEIGNVYIIVEKMFATLQQL